MWDKYPINSCIFQPYEAPSVIIDDDEWIQRSQAHLSDQVGFFEFLGSPWNAPWFGKISWGSGKAEKITMRKNVGKMGKSSFENHFFAFKNRLFVLFLTKVRDIFLLIFDGLPEISKKILTCVKVCSYLRIFRTIGLIFGFFQTIDQSKPWSRGNDDCDGKKKPAGWNHQGQ